MTLTQSIGNARSSLSTVSEQISVVSQNIARVNDSDATRKIANVITVGGGGVSVAGISRTANKLLLDTYLSANASIRLKPWSTRRSTGWRTQSETQTLRAHLRLSSPN